MTPWELAKPGTEHAHQRALFAWAANAALFGFNFAWEEAAYDHRTREHVSQRIWANPVPKLERLFAVHNQGHGDQIRGARAKAEGVKAGVPDIMLPVAQRGIDVMPCNGLFIELKRPKAVKRQGIASDKQFEWLAYLNDEGYIAVVCYGWEHAATTIQNYMERKLTR